MGLFIRKSIESLQDEAAETGSKTLKRVLGPVSLVALGVGVIIGAGLFSITGTVAASYSGPAITLSFIIAAIGCCFAGLCYAEFASMIPVAGSAYTYSYATMGELIAWIIGWDLVLEYTVAATTVSISWVEYLTVFCQGIGIEFPHALTACPWDGGIINIPAMVIVVLMSIILMRGTAGSSFFNGLIVFLKIAVILIFVILGWKFIQTDNYIPYIPENTGKLGEFGISGILRGAAIVFFAFLGFDAVSTAAQETKNPKRDMPIGILVSLLICTILYTLFAHVMTGVAHYTEFEGQVGNRSGCRSYREDGLSGCSRRCPARLSVAEQGNHTCHPFRLLFGNHGHPARPKPGIPEHEPRRTASAFLLKNQRKIPHARPQQLPFHGAGQPARRVCSGRSGRRNDKHRHLAGFHSGVRRHSGGTQNHARHPPGFQDTFRAFRPDYGHTHLPLHDVLPARRHVDPTRLVDACGTGRIRMLRHQAQQARTWESSPAGRHRAERARAGSVGTERHHRTVAPANRGMAGRQDIAHRFIRVRLCPLRLLYVADMEALART